MTTRRSRTHRFTLLDLHQLAGMSGQHIATQKTVSYAYRRLIQFFGNASLSTINATDLHRYLQHRLTVDQVRPSTAASELLILKRAVQRAVSTAHLPQKLMRPFLMVQPMNEHRIRRRPRVLTVQEAANLLRSTPAWLQRLILTTLYAGLRPSEIVALRWADIHTAQHQLRLSCTSHRHTRVIPLPHLVSALLSEMQIDSTRSSHVFADAQGHPLTLRTLSAAFRNHTDKVGLAGLRWSDLRASFVCWGLRSGASSWVLSRMMGLHLYTTTMMMGDWNQAPQWDPLDPVNPQISNNFLELTHLILNNRQHYGAFLVSVLSRVAPRTGPSESLAS